MTTRQRAQRGDDLKEFEGRVRKWRKEWQPAGDTVKTKGLKFYKWAPTGMCYISSWRTEWMFKLELVMAINIEYFILHNSLIKSRSLNRASLQMREI